MFTTHHAIGTPVGLPHDDGDFRHRGLSVGVQQLRAVLDDPAMFLGYAREVARNIRQSNDGDVEGIAKADKAGCLDRGVDVEAAGQRYGLVGDKPDRLSPQAPKANHHIPGKVFLNLEELAVVHHYADQLLHIVRSVGAVRDKGVQGILLSLRIVSGLAARRIFQVVLREIRKEFPDRGQALLL